MKPEMIILLWAVGLAFVQLLIAAQGAFNQVGLKALAGNREGFPVLTGWAGRAGRAHANMIDNLVLFIALVFIGVVMGKSNQMTVVGAQLFFWARVAYALLYIGGITWLRTGAWFISIVGMALMFVQFL